MILKNFDIPVEKWRAVLGESQHSTPFQTPEFFRLIDSTPGLMSHAFAIDSGGHLVALAVIVVFSGRGLTGFFSRRGIIFGGPLVLPGRTDALDSLLSEVSDELSGQTIYLETRNYSDYGLFRDTFQRHGWSYVPYLDIRIQTGDRDSMNSAISSSRRRQIRKAAANGAEIREACSISDIEAFYAILKNHYRKKVRKPLMPWEFFSESFNRKFGHFLLVFYKGVVIGGIYCPVLERRSIFEFYICGLDHEYKDQYPSVMATWAAMEYATSNGILFFDLMGAGVSAKDYGVREFKARFGGRQEEFGRFLKINRKLLYLAGSTAVKLMSKLSVIENSD